MNYYPIVIPTLNRYEKFKQCIESLKFNNISNETELIVGLDYPPSEKYFDGYNKIKLYLNELSGFKKITIFEREYNFGSYQNSNELKQYAFSRYDACIFSEDDNIFSPFFLDYMNSALDKYKEDNSIFAICGYSYPINWETSNNCIIQKQYCSAWGIGIWKKKEEKFSSFLEQKNFRKEFCRIKNKKYLLNSPFNLYQLYYLCYADKLPYCDITRSAYLLFTEKYVLMPTQSLVLNTGWDNSGEHCKKNFKNIFDVKLNNSFSVEIQNPKKVFSKDLENKLKLLINKKVFLRIKICFFIVSIFGFWPFDLLHMLKKWFKK